MKNGANGLNGRNRLSIRIEENGVILKTMIPIEKRKMVL